MRKEIIAYRDLAERFSATLVWEESFMIEVASLPSLNLTLLDDLYEASEQIARTRPRLGWSLMVVANAAAKHHQPDDRFLQAKAAWYEARLANEWVDVERAAAALDRAEPLFASLDETSWLAACQWQRNAYPWTKAHFPQAQTELELALAGLETNPPLAHLIPHCRLSLAYAQFLNGQYEASLEKIKESEGYFSDQGDQFNQARCWFTRAANLRRQFHFEAALNDSLAALDLFQAQEALVDVARTQNLLAFIYWLHQDDFAAAINALQIALALFREMEIPLWIQQAQQALAQVYNATGNLTEAGHILDQAITWLRTQNMTGPLGDALVDRAVNASWRNDYDHCLQLLAEAQTLAEQSQFDSLLAITSHGQGSVHLALNRYQDALASVEHSYQYFARLNNSGRMAACEITLAVIWARLGRADKAHEWLDKAKTHQQLAQEADLLSYLYLIQAEIFYRENKSDSAVTILQEILALTQQQGKLPYVARIEQLLGQVLVQADRLEEADPYLRRAEAYFVQEQQQWEQAACQIVWGDYYRKMGDVAAAAQAWEQALALNQDLMPELIWQAKSGLAGLAEDRGAVDEALAAYAAAIEALTHQRENLKLASLSGSFFKQPGPMVDQAIGLAISTRNHEQALHFIETSKAVILTQQLKLEPLSLAHLPSQTTQKLNDLSAEIRQLHEKLQLGLANSHSIWQRSKEETYLRQQIVTKAQAYEDLINSAERQLAPNAGSAFPLRRFALPTFRSFAQKALGDNWVALEYHLAKDYLYGVLITPDNCVAWQQKISVRQDLVLDMLVKLSSRDEEYFSEDLTTVGTLLFPEWICDLLTPDTLVLISPHQRLHHLPWAALQPKTMTGPLVTGCIPVLVPSLHSLTLLWQRGSEQPFALGSGMLITVADFQGRHPELTGVLREAGVLRELLGDKVEELRDAAATWPNFLNLAQDQGLQRFNWLHIASHAYHDRVTGWLSGFALHDRDVWLTELKQCAPLPHLVTLSVCSGSRNHVQHGDEQISLSTTCLVAGAQTVISNLWPLPDDTTPEWMGHFYHHIVNGKNIALALALAQRTAWEQRLPLIQWSGFSCMGQP